MRRDLRYPSRMAAATGEANPPGESSPRRQPAAAATPRPAGKSPETPATTSAQAATPRRLATDQHGKYHHAQKQPGGKGRVKQDEADAIKPHPHGTSPAEAMHRKLPRAREGYNPSNASTSQTAGPATITALVSAIGATVDTATANGRRDRPEPAGQPLPEVLAFPSAATVS